VTDAQQGTLIEIGVGEFELSAPLEVKAGLTLKGAGVGKTIITHTADWKANPKSLPAPMFPFFKHASAFTLLFLSGFVAEAAVWKTSQGQSFEAEFVRMEGTNVIFSMADGRKFLTPLLQLSPESQAVIHRSGGAPIEALRSNFGRPWPREVRPNGNPACKVISEDREKSLYIYESPGYRFQCDARITQDALSNFATLFEATRAYLADLPVSLMSGEVIATRSKVLLFGEKEAYFKSGGMQGSAGCYIPQHRLVLIPMESLGLMKGGTGYSRDVGKEDLVLIHELVHQLTPNAYYSHGALGWFSEGLAEYVAATPYNTGMFRPDIYGNAVKAYVTAYGTDGKSGRSLGTNIKAPPLRDFMLQSYASFSGDSANANYGLSLLLTHYFFHMEGDGKARRITEFLKGLQSGSSGEASLEPLHAGGGFGKLEEEISAAWAKKGINITFGS